MKYFRNILFLIVLSIFSGCSEGGGSNSAVTGTFIDDPVQGLGYTCSSGTTGITDVNGEYSCEVGDDVTFSINGVLIGSVSAQTTAVTPYSLFPNDTKAALNFARLLQSIDTGSVNGKIVIDTLKEQKIPSTIDFSSASFETVIQTALGITLVSKEEARRRLNDAITSAGGSVPTDLNHIPVASAGADQNVNTTSTVTLNGSASSDADADSLTYTWSIIYKPTLSSATLLDATVVNPTFTVDVDGGYVLSLVVNDGSVDSVADTVIINATTVNSVPVANAGLDQDVNTTSLVTLDGSSSSDANADPLTYTWSMTSKPAGSSATLSDATVVNSTFTADVDGVYVLSLVVNDGTVNSVADTVRVNATTANSVPVANAGLDQDVSTSATVTLDGSASSDVNTDPLTYTWSITSKPTDSTATLSDATVVNPTFRADVDGVYVLSLVVNDGSVDSVADSVTINATRANAIPVASAGADQNVNTFSLVTLNGSASYDADSDPLTYKWRIASKPAGSTATLSDATVVNPTFTADVNGAYILGLRVNDGSVNSTKGDTVTINATTANSAPIANAGPNQNVNTTAIVGLDGSASYDADADPLTYAWSITSKPAGSSATLSDAIVVNPTFRADVDGVYVLHLVVSDGTFSSSNGVTVNATTVNSAPTANAGADQNVSTSATVTLDGSASSDVNTDPLTYTWSIIYKPTLSNATLSDATVVNPTYTADVNGVYVLSLVVNDGSVDSVADTVSINVTSAKIIKRTGWTNSYDANGVEVTDNSLKDDGYYQKGVTPDYIRASDTVTDERTHLMWQDDAAVASVLKQWLTSANYTTCDNNTSSPACYDTSGDTAATYCTNLTLGGYTDWRLPTAAELEDIVDYSRVPALDTNYFNNFDTHYYWSSTTYKSDKKYTWLVYFYTGKMFDSHKDGNNHVRCVRDGQ